MVKRQVIVHYVSSSFHIFNSILNIGSRQALSSDQTPASSAVYVKVLVGTRKHFGQHLGARRHMVGDPFPTLYEVQDVVHHIKYKFH